LAGQRVRSSTRKAQNVVSDKLTSTIFGISVFTPWTFAPIIQFEF
jgi:hypothetical protein